VAVIPPLLSEALLSSFDNIAYDDIAPCPGWDPVRSSSCAHPGIGFPSAART